MRSAARTLAPISRRFSSKAVMEGNGAYNRAGVAQMSLVDYTEPLLASSLSRLASAKLVDNLPSSSPLPIRIADLGASQGRNSVVLIDRVLSLLDAQLPEDLNREYAVLHEDLPANDFATLLETLDSPESYKTKRSNVFSSVMAKSFYERLVPTASIDVFVSYIALHWLAFKPTPLPGHLVSLHTISHRDLVSRIPHIHSEWQKAAERDLVQFLRLRADELVDNGVLCATMLMAPSEIRSDYPFQSVSRALVELVKMELLSEASLDKMCVGMYCRNEDEFMEALVQVPELELIEVSPIEMPLAAPTPQLAAAFFLSVVKPSLSGGMTAEEIANPKFHSELTRIMTDIFSEDIIVEDGKNLGPAYKNLIGNYLYVSMARKQRGY